MVAPSKVLLLRLPSPIVALMQYATVSAQTASDTILDRLCHTRILLVGNTDDRPASPSLCWPSANMHCSIHAVYLYLKRT